MANHLHSDDLPAGLDLGPVVAIDTETMGLRLGRDRLCVVQLSAGDGDAHVVRIPSGQRAAPRLEALLANREVLKLFHFGRFDIAVLQNRFGVDIAPVYCTKIASKLARTYTQRHGLRDLVKEIVGIELSKEQQSSDWGRDVLTAEQLDYAAADVLHLHNLRAALDEILEREGRTQLAEACFRFLPELVRLDAAGWHDLDIFAH
ncbi:MAG: ribonuclease D [Paracoccaceae bacterium]|nr:ribonuclease D [Paracoccaceae bacterium]